jgi:hypothetical protein
MISPRLVLLCGCLLATPVGAANIPEAQPASRYAKLSQESPFALATPTAAPVEQTPSVFANLFVVGLARLRDPIHGDRDFVTVKSRLAEEKPFTLSGTEPNKEGFSIVSIDRSDRVGKSKVTVKKGTEVGVLEFNEMAMQPQAGSGQPGAVNLPGNGVPRPNGAGQ